MTPLQQAIAVFVAYVTVGWAGLWLVGRLARTGEG